MADPGVPGQRGRDVALEPDEAAAQVLATGLPGGRIGHRHHAGGGALVLHFGAVDAQATNPALRGALAQGDLGERPEVLQACVGTPRLLAVHVATHRVTAAMTAVLRIHAGHDGDVLPAPFRSDTATGGAAINVGGHRHRHAAGRVRRAQRVVVHHVVGVVVVQVGLQLVPRTGQVVLLEAGGVAGALERGTVHAAAGVARDRIAGAGRQLQHGIGVGRPADRDIAVPLAPPGGHHIAVAVLVVIRFGAVAVDAHIARRCAGGEIEHLVVAVARADQRTGVDVHARLIETWRVAFEAHCPGRGTGAPAHALRPLDDGQPVEGFRGDVGQRVVHPRGTRADQVALVTDDVQARAEHAAQHRIAVGAAVADRGEAGNRLQVIGAIAGRHRLPRQARIGDPVQR